VRSGGLEAAVEGAMASSEDIKLSNAKAAPRWLFLVLNACRHTATCVSMRRGIVTGVTCGDTVYGGLHGAQYEHHATGSGESDLRSSPAITRCAVIQPQAVASAFNIPPSSNSTKSVRKTLTAHHVEQMRREVFSRWQTSPAT
jgi:hypothetical protein